MKKYLVIPGTIVSPYDGQKHTVTAMELIRLYDVTFEECVILHPGYLSALTLKRNYSGLIELTPQVNGDYSIFKNGLSMARFLARKKGISRGQK